MLQLLCIGHLTGKIFHCRLLANKGAGWDGQGAEPMAGIGKRSAIYCCFRKFVCLLRREKGR